MNKTTLSILLCCMIIGIAGASQTFSILPGSSVAYVNNFSNPIPGNWVLRFTNGSVFSFNSQANFTLNVPSSTTTTSSTTVTSIPTSSSSVTVTSIPTTTIPPPSNITIIANSITYKTKISNVTITVDNITSTTTTTSTSTSTVTSSSTSTSIVPPPFNITVISNSTTYKKYISNGTITVENSPPFSIQSIVNLAKNQTFDTVFFSNFNINNKTCQETQTYQGYGSNMPTLVLCTELIGQNSPSLYTIIGSYIEGSQLSNLSSTTLTSAFITAITTVNDSGKTYYDNWQASANVVTNDTTWISQLQNGRNLDTGALFVAASIIIAATGLIYLINRRAKKNRLKSQKERGGN